MWRCCALSDAWRSTPSVMTGAVSERDIAVAMRSIADLRVLAGRLISGALETHKGVARELRGAGDQDAANLLFRLIAGEEAEAQRLGVRNPAGSEAETSAGGGVTTPSTLFARAMRPVEDMVDIFLAAAERSQDEEVVRETQRLAGVAITWLAELRAGLGASD